MWLTFVAERHGLKDAKKTEDLQMKVIDSLRDHCTYNTEAMKKPQFFSRILGKIPELRSLSREGLKRLEELKKLDIAQLSPAIDHLFHTSQLPFWSACTRNDDVTKCGGHVDEQTYNVINSHLS